MFKFRFAAAALVACGVAHASLITTSAPGDLMFEYLGGEAGPSLQEFGIGTPAENSAAADRNRVFLIDYRNPPVPVPIVNKGYYWSGSPIDFYNLSDWAGDLFAFSSRLTDNPRPQDLGAFTDTDNSLHMGGSAVQTLGGNAWLLHLDDAWSFRVDDDDNELLIKVWVDQSAIAPELPPAAPEPPGLGLVGAGVVALVSTRRKPIFAGRVLP